MSREITITKGKFGEPLPEGRRRFVVAGPVEKKYGKKGGEFFVWKLQYEGGIGEQVLLPNMMGGLLRVLGCEETEPDKYDWDTNEQEGKAFIATVKLVPDRDDPKIVRRHMGEYAKVEEDENSIPF